MSLPRIPLTHAEKRIYLTQKLHPESSMWNAPLSLRFASVDRTRLVQAVTLVLRATEGLQVIFEEMDNEPFKRRVDNFEPVIHELDFSDKGEEAFLKWAEKESSVPTPMLGQLPYYLAVADTGNGTAYFYSKYHHIQGDGGTVDLIFRLILHAYEELGKGNTPSFPPVPPLETAYETEKAYLASEQCAEDKAYWNDLFQDIPEPMDIAGRPSVESVRQVRFDHVFSSAASAALMEYCAARKISPFRVVLGAMGLVLSRTLRREDVVIGTGTANRHPKEMYMVAGMFVSTSAMRLDIQPDATFENVVNQASDAVRNARKHERYPYDMLISDIRSRTGEAPDLASCTLVEMVRAPYPDYASAIAHNYGESLISLTGFLTYPHRDEPQDSPVILGMMFNEELFDEWRIRELARHIEDAVLVGVQAPETPVSTLDFLDKDERQTIFERFNQTRADWKTDVTLPDCVAQIARRYPGRNAVVYRGKALTYGELDSRSNALARTLKEQGAGRGKVVGLMADRSIDIIVAQIAILKSGSAFMPIDAEYPDSRIQFMVEDIAAPFILTQQRFIDERDFGNALVINMDDASVYENGTAPLVHDCESEDTGVVIYTSGSTGKPKGVLLPHRAVCNIIHYTMAEHAITPEDRISKHASFSFDASLLEVFTALMSGAELHVIPEEIRLSLSHLNEYYETNGITWAFLTTQLGEQFMNYMDNSSLRYLVIGGEKMRTFTPRSYNMYNIYGPTECAIYATSQTITQFEDNIPIGPPVGNCRIYILDRHDNLQPVGFAGELCIAGTPVGIGYHNRSDKNAECFVDDPFFPGERMYRTGDLACWRHDGSISHLGRIDRQVKLRGFRIELGEIENAMLGMDGVNEAAVADFKDAQGHVYLCGFFCGDADCKTVTEQLGGKVPPFMVPAQMVCLESMPINPSGKIDRKKLQAPEVNADNEQEYVAPEGKMEIALAAIWGEILNMKQVSAEADFFQNGGDSLRAVALQLTIVRNTGKDVELATIFENPTPRKMAAKLEQDEGQNESITPAAPAEHYPTTIAQQQLYLLSNMQGIGTTYNMPFCLSFEGKLDTKRLSDALLALVERHESLRTAFVLHDGQCMQQVLQDAPLKLEYARTSHTDPKKFAAGFVRPFNLSRPPLMQAKLVEHESGNHWLLLDFHHIAFDGVSVGIFLRELMALYGGGTLEPLPIQHKDVAAWETDRQSDIRNRHESFWFDLFAEPLEGELPTDFPRPGHQSFKGDIYRHMLPDSLTKAVNDLARKHGATLHQVFLAAISVLAGRWADCDDTCIGTSMSGRDKAGTAGIVGMFVRTLPTRLQPEADKTFATLLEETRQQMRSIHEHGEYPVNGLYEHLGANRGPGRHPLFDINFVMRNTGTANRFEADGIKAEVGLLHGGTAKFDISIAAEETDGALGLEMDYRSTLYRRETIARMAGHLCRILEQAAASPEQPLGAMEIIGREERTALLTEFNPTATPAPEWTTVCQAIARHAQECPDHIAVVAEDGTLTYGELDRLANRAARAIAAAGGGADKIVAVVADRSIWSVAGMVAALKSGSAYVGLDANYPPDRIAFILEDTAAPCVVGSAEQVARIENAPATIVLDGALDGNLPEDDSDPQLARGGSDLAYCIFTSGSTGKPKGVLIEHAAMVNFIDWYATHHKMTRESACSAFAAFSFDVSVVQVFAPLVSGSTLHVIPENLRRSPHDLDDYFTRNNITNAHFPTQFAEQFMRMCPMKSLRHLVVGGDSLRNYKLGDFVLTNEYGPSETTMACLSYDVPELLTKPPVGSPVANTRIYILDSRDNLCPIGVPGEICVAGTGVGRGYLNREELTAKCFVEDPFVPGERMFKTGDKGRWLEDGTVDFIGRMDFQVKIRGYRVEPGEIEARIKEADTVLECVVVPLEEPNGKKVLAAYCTASSEVNIPELKSSLKSRLPEYMVPAHVVQLDKMPLSPNGKIDRGKLPRPEITGTTAGPLEPRNAKEKRIAQAWENVLGHKGFGLFDSFYEVGGDSLSAIALLADLSETFDISASDLFAHTTIAEQAAHFQEAETGRSARLLKLKNMAKPAPEDSAFAAQVAAYEAAQLADSALDTDTVKPLEHILLTGATGTLGVYLLRELLETTDAKITAIVRAKTDEAAHERLAAHYLDRFDTPLDDAAQDRVQVLTGDLAAPDLGLGDERYDALADSVDAILHSAALTSHYGDWDVFVAANITSVENLATFARTGRPKAMHHLSTTSVGAGQVEERSQMLFTEFDVDMGQESGNLYVRSKLQAEVVLEKYRDEGLPVTVYRAGNITCDSETGAFQRNVDDNAFYQQLRAYVNLGAAPDKLDMRNMTFVDQAARSIVTVMQRPGLAGQTFHIHNPHLLSLSQALSDEALGLRLSRLDFDEFIDFFAEHAALNGFGNYVERLLVHLGWQDWLTNPSRTATNIRVERSAALLERCGFTWREPTAEDLRQFVAHALEDRAGQLTCIPGFNMLDKNILTDIAARIQPHHFGSEDLLQQEGKDIGAITFVVDGMVETYRRNSKGWIGTIRVSGPGACIGEEAALTTCPARTSVEALDDTFAYRFDLKDIRELTMRHPQLGLALLQSAADKANQAECLFLAL